MEWRSSSWSEVGFATLVTGIGVPTTKKTPEKMSEINLNHEWPRKNFSLQYQYGINQTSVGNKEKCQFGKN